MFVLQRYGNMSTYSLQEGEEKKEKKKKVVKTVELPIESLTFGFSQVELNQYTEQEFKMIAGKVLKAPNVLYFVEMVVLSSLLYPSHLIQILLFFLMQILLL